MGSYVVVLPKATRVHYTAQASSEAAPPTGNMESLEEASFRYATSLHMHVPDIHPLLSLPKHERI